MIRISDKSLCCGCSACVTACPAQCIVLRRDREGFDYPVANPDLCIGCGKCEEICPVLKPLEVAEPLAAYAVRVPEYVDGSSSGGVFPALAGKVTADGGVVYGAIFNADMTVGHMEAETMEEVEKMRGSKYVQSDLYDTYAEVKARLAEGRKVLFTGTPCHVAGLNRFLGRPYDNLLTVDVACHGVPSPGLWEKYVAALGRKYGSRISDVKFRDKSQSWRNYAFSFEAGGQTVSVPHIKDPYLALFLQDMSLRPSCYSCPSKGGRSHSDITLADMWNTGAAAGVEDDDRGLSLVVACTPKGMAALQAVGVRLTEVDYAEARKRNAGFDGSAVIPEHRDEFFAGIHSTKDIISYMSGFVVRKCFMRVWYEKLHTLLSRLKRRISK